jgi:hypothetical protein
MKEQVTMSETTITLKVLAGQLEGLKNRSTLSIGNCHFDLTGQVKQVLGSAKMFYRNGPTSGRHPVLRLLFVGVALILRYVWVWLHAEVVVQPRRGGRRLHAASLWLNWLLLWLASTRIADKAQRSWQPITPAVRRQERKSLAIVRDIR